MIKTILLSKEHLVYQGKIFESSSLKEISQYFKNLGLDISSPIGNNNRQFILILKTDLPKNFNTQFRNQNTEWISLHKAIENDSCILDMYCKLLLGGYVPPALKWDVFYFGSPGFMASQLAHLVAKGQKRLSAGWVAAHEKTALPLPYAGCVSVVTDGFGIPICAIETEHVEIRPFNQVDESIAWREGEGDKSLEDWKQGHWDYWTQVEAPEVGLQFSENSEIFLESFRLLKVFAGHDC